MIFSKFSVLSRIVFVGFSLAASIIFLLALPINHAVISTGNSKPPIRIAVIPWIGYSHFYIAEQKFFKQNHVDVQLIKVNDYPASQQLYSSGQVDGNNEVFADTIFHVANGLPTRAVFVEDYSLTGDIIIGKQTNLTDLRGKIIGIEGINSYAHLFVLKSLERVGLSEKDVQFRNILAGDAVAAIDRGDVDAAYTWGTSIPDAQSRGYHVLATAREVQGMITDVLVFNEKIIQQRPDDVQRIVKSLVEAREFISLHHEEALQILSRSQNTSESELESALGSIYLLNLDDNVKAFQSFNNTTSLYDSGRILVSFDLDRGQISSAPSLNDTMDSRFVKDIWQKSTGV